MTDSPAPQAGAGRHVCRVRIGTVCREVLRVYAKMFWTLTALIVLLEAGFQVARGLEQKAPLGSFAAFLISFWIIAVMFRVILAAVPGESLILLGVRAPSSSQITRGVLAVGGLAVGVNLLLMLVFVCTAMLLRGASDQALGLVLTIIAVAMMLFVAWLMLRWDEGPAQILPAWLAWMWMFPMFLVLPMLPSWRRIRFHGWGWQALGLIVIAGACLLQIIALRSVALTNKAPHVVRWVMVGLSILTTPLGLIIGIVLNRQLQAEET